MAREITEGLKPIREGIEKLPQALGKEEEEEEEEEYGIGKIAKINLNRPSPGTTFGVREEQGHHYIGDKHVIIFHNDIIIGDEKFEGTPGLWELITSKNPIGYNKEDLYNYESLMEKTNALHRGYDSDSFWPRSNKSKKWNNILSIFWENRKRYEGKGVVVILRDPNALLERLDLLLASQKAGHMGVRND